MAILHRLSAEWEWSRRAFVAGLKARLKAVAWEGGEMGFDKPL